MSSLSAATDSRAPLEPLMAHDELRYRCPNCCARMQSIRAIERGIDRAQHVYKCPRCSVIMTERPEE